MHKFQCRFYSIMLNQFWPGLVYFFFLFAFLTDPLLRKRQQFNLVPRYLVDEASVSSTSVSDYTKLYGNSKLEKSSHSQLFQGVVCVYITCSTFSRCLEICALWIIQYSHPFCGKRLAFLCIKIAVFLIFTLICFCFWF